MFTPEQEAFLAKYAQDNLDAQAQRDKEAARDAAIADAQAAFEAAKAKAISDFNAEVATLTKA